jgi:hypothetical protein
MASDTTLEPSGSAVDDCIGFAEPADILTRLDPDDLYPARLAGPHAWHPWSLTVAPPTDRHLRLILPARTRTDIADLLLDRLEHHLARTPWRAEGPLAVRRRHGQLHCRDVEARRSLIEIDIAPGASSHQHADVVTRDGWPILDELAALNDRTRCLNLEQPTRTDLADLASWVEHKMTEAASGQSLATSLSQLLVNQIREHPASADRLRTILAHRERGSVHQQRVLDYLAEQLDYCRPHGHARRRR